MKQPVNWAHINGLAGGVGYVVRRMRPRRVAVPTMEKRER